MISETLLGWFAGRANHIFAGVVGGVVGAGLKEAFQYLWGWHRAGRNESADFHIAATLYFRIDPAEPHHAPYLPALQEGKTHVQELIWLGAEVALKDFISNRYVFKQVTSAMSEARNAGLLLGELPERAQRPLLKKIVGYHNSIPANDIVKLLKRHVSTDKLGRVHGISPPTHEHYSESPHRRVLRAMFVADAQLAHGLPPKTHVHFPNSAHGHRYDTLEFLIEEYKVHPDKFVNCRVYF